MTITDRGQRKSPEKNVEATIWIKNVKGPSKLIFMTESQRNLEK